MIHSPRPRKEPKQDRSSATVDAILEAAVQVLERESSSTPSTTRIAERAGVSVGSLYQYFPNRDALVAAVIRRFVQRRFREIEAHIRELEELPLEGGLRQLAGILIELELRHTRIVRILMDWFVRVGNYEMIAEADGEAERALEAILRRIAHKTRPLDPKLASFVLSTTSATCSVPRRIGRQTSCGLPPHTRRWRDCCTGTCARTDGPECEGSEPDKSRSSAIRSVRCRQERESPCWAALRTTMRMRLDSLCMAATAATLLLGCKYDCTRYRDRSLVEGELTGRESSRSREARAANDSGAEPERTTMRNGEMEAFKGHPVWCSAPGCVELSLHAGNFRLFVPHPVAVGSYLLEEHSARLCEHDPSDKDGDSNSHTYCVPAHGRLTVSAIDIACDDESGHEACSWLDASLTLEEEADPSLPSLSGSVHVVLDNVEYEETCGGGFGVPNSPG